MAEQVKRRRAKQPTPQQARIEAARGRHPYDRLDEETLRQIEQFRVLSFHLEKHKIDIDIRPLAPLMRDPDAKTRDRLYTQLDESPPDSLEARRYILGLLMERDPRVPSLAKPLLRKELQMDGYGHGEMAGRPGAAQRARWYKSQYPDATPREIARYLDIDHSTVGRWARAGLFTDFKELAQRAREYRSEHPDASSGKVADYLGLRRAIYEALVKEGLFEK